MIRPFASRLRAARLRRKLTIKLLAAKAQMGESTLFRLESGLAGPAVSSIRRLAVALDVSADYLLGLAPWSGESDDQGAETGEGG